jgi:hypothetical protein
MSNKQLHSAAYNPYDKSSTTKADLRQTAEHTGFALAIGATLAALAVLLLFSHTLLTHMRTGVLTQAVRLTLFGYTKYTLACHVRGVAFKEAYVLDRMRIDNRYGSSICAALSSLESAFEPYYFPLLLSICGKCAFKTHINTRPSIVQFL